MKTALSLVEKVLRMWQRRLLERQLKAGYRAMAAEDQVVAEKAMRIAWEAIK